MRLAAAAALLVLGVPTLSGADELTATTVAEDGMVLFATETADGETILTSVDPDTFDASEENLGAGSVTDLEQSPFGDLAAFEDGDIMVLGGGWMEAPFDGLHAVAYSADASAFGNTTELALCDAVGESCELFDMGTTVSDVTVPPPPCDVCPEDLVAVVVDGEVQFFRGTTFVAVMRPELDGLQIQSFRTRLDQVGISVGPCTIVYDVLTDEGMAIPDAGVRFVLFEDLGDAEGFARARQGVILGSWITTDFEGELLLDVEGRIVEVASGDLVAEMTGISVFPTALSEFDLGPPLSGVALGGSAGFIDQDGAGPTPPETVIGSVVHFSEPQLAPDHIRRPRRGRARGFVTAHLEIPGAFAQDVDLETVSLGGVAPARARGLEDSDGDGEPELPVKFRRGDLLDALPDGFSSLVMTGEVDGVPFQGTTSIEVR